MTSHIPKTILSISISQWKTVVQYDTIIRLSDYTVSAKLWRKLLDGKKKHHRRCISNYPCELYRVSFVSFSLRYCILFRHMFTNKKNYSTRHSTRSRCDLVARNAMFFFHLVLLFKSFLTLFFFKSLHFFQLRYKRLNLFTSGPQNP